MTATVVNIGSNSTVVGGTVTITVGAGGVPAGADIFVDTSDNGTGTGGIADTAGNSYANTHASNTGIGLTLWRKRRAAALVNGNTIVYTVFGTLAAVNAFYVTGLADLPADVSNTATGSSTTPSVASGAPSGARRFFVGVVGGATLVTSFTQDSTNAAWASPPGSVSNAAPVLGGGNVVNAGSGSLTYAPTFGTSDVWVAIISGYVVDAPPGQSNQVDQLLAGVPDPIISPQPSASWALSALAQQKMFGAGGQVPTKLWHHDNVTEPGWNAAPIAAAAMALIALPLYYNPPPIWAPDPDPPPQWQGAPEASWILRELTQQRYFGGGGQAPNKTWRYDHVPEPVWLSAPHAAASLLGLPQYYNPTPVWSPDPDPPPQWQGEPVAGDALLLGTLVLSPFKAAQQHVYQADDPPPWLPGPLTSWPLRELTQQKFFGTGGQVPTKAWRWDHVQDPFWQGEPSFISQALSASPFKAAQQRCVFDDPPQWQGLPRGNSVIFLTRPFVVPWRYDYTEATTSTPPAQRNAALLAAPAKPFYTSWRPDLAPENYRQPSPAATSQVLLLTLPQPYAVPPQWQTPGDQAPFAWLGRPLASSLELQLRSSTTKPFIGSWPPAADASAAYWQPMLLNTTAQLGFLVLSRSPFFAPKTADHQAFWLGAPLSSAQIETLHFGSPFHRMWRYDLHPEPVWLGSATASARKLLALPQLYATPPMWRSDHVPEPVWVGSPQPSAQIGVVTAGTPFFRAWRYDHDNVPAVWTWQAPPSDVIRVLTSGRPTSKFWRWDHEIERALWQGEPLPSAQIDSVKAGTPFARLWRYDYAAEPVWQGAPLLSAQIDSVKGKEPFSRLWRYDHVPEPVWQGSPLPSAQIEAVKAGTPVFAVSWQWNHEPDTSWIPTMFGNQILLLPAPPLYAITRISAWGAKVTIAANPSGGATPGRGF